MRFKHDSYCEAMLVTTFLSICPQLSFADTFPAQLIGAWGGRGEFMGDDRASVAVAACRSYQKNPKEISGDILLFKDSEKQSLGGYVDYTDKNISVTELSPNQWKIVDRHYQDGEGGGKSGYRNVTYIVMLSGNQLTKKEGQYTSRFSKCNDAAVASGDIVPLQRGFYVRADTACENASNATLDVFLGKAFRFNCTATSVQKIGDGYRITQACVVKGEKDVTTSVYRILSKTEYIATPAGRNEANISLHYKYCLQSKLPEPWRNNSLEN